MVRPKFKVVPPCVRHASSDDCHPCCFIYVSLLSVKLQILGDPSLRMTTPVFPAIIQEGSFAFRRTLSAVLATLTPVYGKGSAHILRRIDHALLRIDKSPFETSFSPCHASVFWRSGHARMTDFLPLLSSFCHYPLTAISSASVESLQGSPPVLSQLLAVLIYLFFVCISGGINCCRSSALHLPASVAVQSLPWHQCICLRQLPVLGKPLNVFVSFCTLLAIRPIPGRSHHYL